MNERMGHTKAEEMSLGQIVAALARHYLGRRQGLLMAGIVVAVAGLALNWNWVVAIGLAPILIALAPCAVMCALGVCVHKMAAKPGADNSQTKDDRDV